MSSGEQKGNGRYERQKLIKGWNQERLQEATVFIAGVGAIGNEVAKNLAQAGVGNLIIVDMDTVEASNLNRTVLFSEEDIGENKAMAATEALKELVPNINVEGYGETIQSFLEKNEHRIRGVDAIAGCLDNMEARFLLNHVSVFYRIPMVDGGMIGMNGSVQVSIPPYTPCLECNVSPSAYSNIGTRYSCTAGEYIDYTEMQRAIIIPSIPTVTSIVSGIQSQEIIKIILGLREFRRNGIWPPHIGRPMRGIIQYDGRTNNVMAIELERNPDCYVCGSRYDPSLISFPRKEVLEVSAEDTVAMVMDRIKELEGGSRLRAVMRLESFPSPTLAMRELEGLIQKLLFLRRVVMKTRAPSDAGVVSIDERSFRVGSTISELQKSLSQILEAKTIEEFHKMLSNAAQKAEKAYLLMNDVIGSHNFVRGGGIEFETIRNELQRSLALLKRHLSGESTLRELGLGEFEEMFIVNPDENGIISDWIVLLMVKGLFK